MQETVTKFYFLTIYVLHTSLLIKDEPNLKIFKNVSGDFTKVTSNIIEIPSGINVTLICKLVPYENEKAAQIYVNWFKMPRNSKSSLKVTTDFKNCATLKLDNLSLQDNGHYSCVSLKEGFIANINLIVTNGNIKQNSTNSNKLSLKKFKRDAILGNDTYFHYKPITLKELQENVKLYLESIEQDRKNLEERRKHKSTPVTAPFYSIFFGITLVVTVSVGCVCGIICYCRKYKSNNFNLARINNRAENTPPFHSYSSNRNRCGHSSCTRNYLLNPSSVCRYQDNSSVNIDPLFEAPQIVVYEYQDDGPAPTYPLFESAQIDVPIATIINGSRLRVDLDLPPNYDTSVHSSKCSLHEPMDGLDVDSKEGALPPSYAEALASEHIHIRRTSDH